VCFFTQHVLVQCSAIQIVPRRLQFLAVLRLKILSLLL
jgi:hypothetical protein